MLGTEWGKGKALELVKRILSQQQPLIVQGGTTVANALAGGQVSIAVGTYAYTIERLKKQGAAVDWVPVSPLPVLTFGEWECSKPRPIPTPRDFLPVGSARRRDKTFDTATTGQAIEVGKNGIGNGGGKNSERQARDHLGDGEKLRVPFWRFSASWAKCSARCGRMTG